MTKSVFRMSVKDNINSWTHIKFNDSKSVFCFATLTLVSPVCNWDLPEVKKDAPHLSLLLHSNSAATLSRVRGMTSVLMQEPGSLSLWYHTVTGCTETNHYYKTCIKILVLFVVLLQRLKQHNYVNSLSTSNSVKVHYVWQIWGQGMREEPNTLTKSQCPS